ncbi:MAG: hypothetical protein PHY48_04430 [Candidatus Cloacimonetes bacterium]|nr:hypothetical protein [Candidatus Cloacimonadota bacterium]
MFYIETNRSVIVSQTNRSVIVSPSPLIGLPISELAETVKLSEKHPTDAVANRSLPPHAPASSLQELPYHCPLIVHVEGNGWAMIGQ